MNCSCGSAVLSCLSCDTFYKFGEATKCCGKPLPCGMCNKIPVQEVQENKPPSPSLHDLYLAYKNKLQEIFPEQPTGMLDDQSKIYWRQYGNVVVTSILSNILTENFYRDVTAKSWDDYGSLSAELSHNLQLIRNVYKNVQKTVRDKEHMYFSENQRIIVLSLEREVK